MENNVLTKADLAEQLASMAGMNMTNAEAMKVVDAMGKILTCAFMSGAGVQLRGFGTFKAVEKRAHKGYNFKTGETVEIPASRTVTFKVGKQLKKLINQ